MVSMVHREIARTKAIGRGNLDNKEYYTWLSNQLRYFSSETASTAIGMKPW